MMGLFDRDYDREYGRRPRSNNLDYDTWRYRAGGREAGNRDYNSRNYLNSTTAGYSEYDGAFRGGAAGYDRGMRGYDSSMRGYDRGMRRVGIGYDEQYKSRQQTDAGDPFGDRQNHTPIRMIRGEPHGYDRDMRGDYDRGFRNRGYDRDHGYSGRDGRDFASNPVSYDPGYGGSRRGMNRYDNSWFGNNRGYDRDWF
jgi:hypothetical protein